jgi:hypothetical protein
MDVGLCDFQSKFCFKNLCVGGLLLRVGGLVRPLQDHRALTDGLGPAVVLETLLGWILIILIFLKK